MRFGSIAALLTGALLVVPVLNSQTPGKPDPSPSELSKFPLFPPKDVSLRDNAGHVEIFWKPSPLERVVEYRVYRKTDSGFVPVGTAKKPPFIDTSPPSSGKVKYTVTAIYEFNHESSYAKAAVLDMREPVHREKEDK